MLDKYENYHTDINVVQQPNDAADAARLYGEIKDKTQDEYRDVLLKNIPSIDATFIKAVRDNSCVPPQVVIWFSVNGHNMSSTIDSGVASNKSHDDRIVDIYNQMSKSISIKIVEQMKKSVAEL